MHETGLCEAIVDTALRRAAGRRVTGVRVRIGGHVVDREVVTQGVRLAAVGTVAEDADVDLVLDPMSAHCRDCGRTGPVADHLGMVACPGCGGVDVEVTGGDEAVLESITFAAGAPDPPGPSREHPRREPRRHQESGSLRRHGPHQDLPDLREPQHERPRT